MKYRVLYDLDTPEDAIPCGVVLDEGKDGVRIIAPYSHALPERVTEPWQMTSLSLETLTYFPGHPDYFGFICESIARTFALGPEWNTERPADYPAELVPQKGK